MEGGRLKMEDGRWKVEGGEESRYFSAEMIDLSFGKV